MPYDSSKIILPSYGPKNFAPLEPILKVRSGEKKADHQLCDAIKERAEHYLKQDESTWREIYNVGHMISLFTEGKQILTRNAYSGEYKAAANSGSGERAKYVMNQMQFYSTNLVSRWMQSNPDIVARPGKDSDESVAAAKAAGIIVDHYESKFYSEWFSGREALSGLNFGTYVNRVRFDEGIKGVMAIREILEDRTLQVGSGFGYCGDCQHSGEAGDFPEETCPRCGSSAVLVEKPESSQIQTVTGTEEVQTGDICIEQLPLPGCRWELSKRAAESSWFIYQQRTHLANIRRLLGNIKLPGSDDASDIGLDILQKLAASGQAVSGRSSHGEQKGLYEEPVNVMEMWLGPDDYADIILKSDEKTISGETLPKGSKLIDLTEGKSVVVVGLNGMSLITGIYVEDHKDHITSGVWHVKGNSGIGRPGMADSVEVQRRFNATDTKILRYLGSTATPAILHDKDLIDTDEMRYLGDEETNIAVDLTRMPETRKLSDAIHSLPPGTVAPQFMQYTQEFLSHMFQISSHVTDFSGGLPGVNNQTATGAQIAASNSSSVFSPTLQIKSGVRKREAEITIELYRNNFRDKQYFPLKGKYGSQQGIYLSGADLSVEVIFDAVTGSEIPKNSVTKREDLQMFFMNFGGYEGYFMAKQQDPESVEEIAQLFNVELGSQNFDYLAQLCRKRLEQMKNAMTQVDEMKQEVQADPEMMQIIAQSAEMLAQMIPQALVEAITPPISEFEPSHQQKAIWWANFLDTDEGQESPQELRDAIGLVIMNHFQAGGAQAAAFGAQAGQAQQAAAAPVAEGEAAAAEGEQAAQAESEAAAAEEENASREHQSMEDESKRYHEASESEKQRKHESEQAGRQREHDYRMAKAKSMGKPGGER